MHDIMKGTFLVIFKGFQRFPELVGTLRRPLNILTILSLFYEALWKMPLVLKGLKIPTTHFLIQPLDFSSRKFNQPFLATTGLTLTSSTSGAKINLSRSGRIAFSGRENFLSGGFPSELLDDETLSEDLEAGIWSWEADL